MLHLNEVLNGVMAYVDHLDALVHQIDTLEVEEPDVKVPPVDLEMLDRERVENDMRMAQAAYKVAVSYAPQGAWDGKPRPFDREKLVSLQVRINPHLNDDPAAVELVNEAAGQLEYLRKAVKQIDALVKKRDRDLSLARKEADAKKQQVVEKLLAQYEAELESSDFQELLSACQALREEAIGEHSHRLLLGYVEITLPRPVVSHAFPEIAQKKEELFERIESPVFNGRAGAVRLPVSIDMDKGGSLVMPREANDKTDYSAIVRDILLRSMAISLRMEALESVTLVDPGVPSTVSLGSLAQFCLGDNPIIRDLPLSRDEVRRVFTLLEEEVSDMERRLIQEPAGRGVKRIIIFESFPQGYDRQELQLVKKMMAIADECHILVIADGVLGDKRPIDINLNIEDLSNTWIMPEGATPTIPDVMLPDGVHFFWESPVPETGPYMQIIQHSRAGRSKNEDNRFMLRASKVLSSPVKGDRTLEHLPIGVGDDGEITYLSFEDDHFAAYVCGAAGSGKSTLLHTLLSAVFASKHPDDVEVWLVDFKMMEFSRYVDRIPPHVRYIVLDESPELVYDLIDRLTDILHKRQAIFKKNGWTSLADAQRAGRYMPALLVIIDEFSIMSQIVAQSVEFGKDYKIKLQELLTKGRAPGFRFVFSSQSFTSGVSGLTNTARRQIQQRIAMKAENDEIKQTLDLSNISEKDSRFIRELTPHYALLKVGQGTAQGSHVERTHVLYFPDIEEQEGFLERSFRRYVSSSHYEVDEQATYIYKQPQVFDGNELTDYSRVRSEARADVKYKAASAYDASSLFLNVGQPLRLKKFALIELVSGFAENILLQIPTSQGESFQSMMLTMVDALQAQGVCLNVVIGRRTELCPPALEASLPNANFYLGEQGISDYLEDSASDGGLARFTIFLELEPLLRGDTSPRTFKRETKDSGLEWLGKNEMDLCTFLRRSDQIGVGDDAEGMNSVSFVPADAHGGEALIRATNECRKIRDNGAQTDEDYRASMLEHLEYGPTRGSHFLFVTPRVAELKRCGVSLNWFKHRMTFRMSRSDASFFVGRQDAATVAELPGNCFRYTDGIEGTTYRPYAHVDHGVFSHEDIDENEYLL